MNPPFVKKFDFRGIYGEDIEDENAYYLGLALARSLDIKKILIGWDTRESSKNLALNFISSLGSDIEISYLDKCPIDYVTAAANAFDFDLSIMFTGSHNPWTWTGLLMHTKSGASIQGELVDTIIKNYNECLNEEYKSPDVDLSKLEDFFPKIEEAYLARLKELIPFEKIKELKVLVDVGDGSGSRALSLIDKALPQVKFERLNDRQLYDQDSPHTADPSNLENMKQLIDKIHGGGHDCGFAFDSDADRVLAIDEKGNYINGSMLGSIHVDTFINLQFPDSDFGYAVDCGPSMQNCIASFDNKGLNIFATAIPVGRSLVRKMITDGKIDFGVENVGHFYSNDFFMTDSGTFSMLITLYWISQNVSLSNVFEKYPDGERAQIFSDVLSDDQTNSLVISINEKFQNYKINKIEQDGIRYEFISDDRLVTWYTMRKSGYEPITKTYYGSIKKEDFKILEEEFEKIKKE